MSRISDPPVDLITRAAEMRAAGESWDAIGKAVGRSPERVRHWPRDYPEDWSRAYRLTETHFLADAAAESRHTLRTLLRSKEEWIQLAAAQQMLKARTAERLLALKVEQAIQAADAKAGISPNDRMMASMIEGVQNMSDEELEETLQEFIAAHPAARRPPSNEPPAGAITAPSDSE